MGRIYQDYYDFFEQTSKAILFERFATEDVDGKPVPSLAIYLDEGEVESGAFHKKIVENLGVRSFEEFLDKFTPWVYEMIEPGETEDSVEIKYSLEKPKGYDETGMNPTALNSTALYEMVNKLYEQRKNSGVPQLNFDFSDIAKVLSPESQTEKIKQARRKMKFYLDEFFSLEEKTPGIPSNEKVKALNMFNNSKAVVQEAYTSGTASLLTLKLGDAGNALLALADSNGKEETAEDGKVYVGIPDYDADGNLKIRRVEVHDKNKGNQIGMNSEQQLLEILQDDFENAAPEYMQKSPEITNLVLSNISTGLARTEHKKEFWLARLESGQQDYKKWMENLANVIAPLIEKFIGVKAFFENATVDGRLDSVLIVANATVTELVDDEKIRNHLSAFLDILSREIKKKIWFAIIPAIALKTDDNEQEIFPVEYIPGGSFRDMLDNKNVPKENKNKEQNLVNARDAKMLLDICEDAGIMTFYNYKAESDTVFGNIKKEIYEKMRDSIVFEKGNYAVCCLPNFTIIPDDERNVIINKQLVERGCQEQLVSIKIPAIYVEASYVAAGMVIGSQQKGMLEKKGFNVDPTLTNIRFDMEGKNVYKKYQSNMCIENDLPVPRDMTEEIMKTRFGFYFSDKRVLGDSGSDITHCYVRNARTMAKNSETKTYDEINNQLFRDFVLALLYGNLEEADPDDAGNIKENDIQEWMDCAQANKASLVDNALMKNSEKISSKDNVEFEFEFVHAKIKTKLKIRSN